MTNQSPKRLRRSALKSATGSPLPAGAGAASSSATASASASSSSAASRRPRRRRSRRRRHRCRRRSRPQVGVGVGRLRVGLVGVGRREVGLDGGVDDVVLAVRGTLGENCSDTLLPTSLLVDQPVAAGADIPGPVVPSVLGDRAGEDPGDDAGQDEVQTRDQRHHDHDEHDHDGRVAHELGARGPHDLAQLVEDLAHEEADRPEEARHRVAAGSLVGPGPDPRLALVSVTIPSFCLGSGPRRPPHPWCPTTGRRRVPPCTTTTSRGCAGQEGLEPPTAGFGDQCSTN